MPGCSSAADTLPRHSIPTQYREVWNRTIFAQLPLVTDFFCCAFWLAVGLLSSSSSSSSSELLSGSMSLRLPLICPTHASCQSKQSAVNQNNQPSIKGICQSKQFVNQNIQLSIKTFSCQSKQYAFILLLIKTISFQQKTSAVNQNHKNKY